MNIYVVVEGNSTEPAVYRKWIPLINSQLVEVKYLDQVTQNNFIIISGNGFPFIKRVISNAIEDIKQNSKFDRLVVSVDSEQFTFQQRFNEIDQYIRSCTPTCQYRIIVQHFCFEAWALGNKKFGPKKPKDSTLKSYARIHNVYTNDPELLPNLPSLQLNRAQFAEKYLKLLIRDKGTHLTYAKNKPDVIAHNSYLFQLEERLKNTSHIQSFQTFIDAFI